MLFSLPLTLLLFLSLPSADATWLRHDKGVSSADEQHRRLVFKPVILSDSELEAMFLAKIEEDVSDGVPGDVMAIVGNVTLLVFQMFPDADPADSSWMDTFLLSDTSEAWAVIEAMAAIYGSDSCVSLMEPHCRTPGRPYAAEVEEFFLTELEEMSSGVVMPDLDSMYDSLNATLGIDEDFADFVIEVRGYACTILAFYSI